MIRRPPFLFVLTIFIFVLIPFLFWRGTWFGTNLTDTQMQQYLADRGKPRRVQHALVQIEKKMADGDASVRRWYPDVLKLAGDPAKEVRITAAWVMGQDSTYPPFYQALLELLRDSTPMVRRNAALSLVRFGDSSGKAEILSMLQTLAVPAESKGNLTLMVNSGDTCEHGKLLGRISSGATTHEVRAPISGSVTQLLARSGETVAPGQKLLILQADRNQIWEALRALYLIGTPEDVPAIEQYVSMKYPDSIQRQAKEAMLEIRRRGKN